MGCKSSWLAGGLIYISADNGQTVVLKPGRTYDELSRNHRPPFRSTPVFTGDNCRTGARVLAPTR